ncbi:MAG: sortase domain-containing protein [Chthoniobacterales bacterium]
MNYRRKLRDEAAIAGFILLTAGAGLVAKPIAHEVIGRVSAAQAKGIWEKWKRAQPHVADSIQPGQPVFWLRIPSCKISTLILAESDADALHRYPAARQLPSGGTVLFAHRDLHFRGLARIKTGQRILLEDAEGRTVVYSVRSIRILPPEEVSAAVADPEKGESLYLMTCFPFHYIGAAPKRFLVRAVKSTD